MISFTKLCRFFITEMEDLFLRYSIIRVLNWLQLFWLKLKNANDYIFSQYHLGIIRKDKEIEIRGPITLDSNWETATIRQEQ